MSDFSDETLMAYADGELPGAERKRVEAALVEDAALARRLQAFLKTGKQLGRVFERELPAAVPQALIDTIRSAPLSGGAGNVVAFDAKAKPRSRVAQIFANRPAIAASVAAVFAGIGAGWWASFPPGDEPGAVGLIRSPSGLVANLDLARVLDAAAMGDSVPVTLRGEAAQAKVAFTFVNQNGEYCRQYSLAAASFGSVDGVACRDQFYEWQSTIQSAAVRAGAPEQKIAPASGPKAAVDAAVDAMIKGDVLGQDAEAGVISRSWRVEP